MTESTSRNTSCLTPPLATRIALENHLQRNRKRQQDLWLAYFGKDEPDIIRPTVGILHTFNVRYLTHDPLPCILQDLASFRSVHGSGTSASCDRSSPGRVI